MTNWIQSLKSPTCCRDSFCLEDPLHSSQDTHQPNAEKHKNVAWEMKIRTQVMSGTKIVANPQNGVTSCHKHIGVEQNFLGRLWTSTVVHSSVTWSKHGKCCTVIHPSWESLYIYIYTVYSPFMDWCPSLSITWSWRGRGPFGVELCHRSHCLHVHSLSVEASIPQINSADQVLYLYHIYIYITSCRLYNLYM